MANAKTVNFDMLRTDAQIGAAIASVHDAGESLQLQIHKVLVAVATRWAKTGDSRQPVLHINTLLTGDKLKGMRKNAMRAWVEKYLGFVYNEETKAFVAGKLKGSDLSIKDIANAHWWAETPEPVYQPVNPEQAIKQLIARFEKDQKKLGDKSAVDPALLAALKAVPVTALAAA